MADPPTRRSGCGCLTLVALFFVGSFGLQLLEDSTDGRLDAGLIIRLALGFFLVLAVVQAVRRARRVSDASADGVPTATGPVSDVEPGEFGMEVPGAPPIRPPAPARSRPAVPAPAPPRPAVRRPTEPPVEDLATKAMRESMRDAMADLTQQVEDAAGTSKALTSEERIAAAKRRIAEWKDD